MVGVQRATLPKYYINGSLFEATRTRAGQYSNWGEAPKFLLM